MIESKWMDKLGIALNKKLGAKQGGLLAKKYSTIFNSAYRDAYSPERATCDINYLEKLSENHPLDLNFYYTKEDSESVLHLKIYRLNKPKPLSDILPILENLDLRIESESSHSLPYKKHALWITDFIVLNSNPNLEIAKLRNLFLEAFVRVYFGISENDGLNKLVINAGLNWQEIRLVRAYTKYLRQVGFRFTQAYIEKAFLNNTTLTKDLVAYFISLHNPNKRASQSEIKKYEEKIFLGLDKISSLDEDKIMRRILDLIRATLRTNYFQLDKQHKPKEYLAIKLQSNLIPEMPLPIPMFEIFVYSTYFEAIHLRNAKVARGGIRWSDRREDFRTEILGLMKAQVVKNAIIVPSGAKGGFVLKQCPEGITDKRTEVIVCYKNFINGLLDITDNIVNKKLVRPKNVVCYDDYDPYLVVAADKGTASFSDIANAISAEHDFWLGDAFASGGSTGYDHKKMGITARGAWESIKRHFRELNIDISKTDITVVGIGDMSGDVFGNGMLYSKHIRLIAAFDHRHIFIDPNPDAKKSYAERARLFKLATSSWEDYNPKLISQGGGVFSRSAKSITLTPQMKMALGVEANTLAPNDLVRAVLKAPVDLLYNGGIGTYVKSTEQTNLDVGDRTNDYCRVNGQELRCRAVGEGGNLGFTQLGRIEYAMNGGLINTDFIDNSGGVDCSDHEVNLKILLNTEVQNGKLSLPSRNKLLASLTDEVASLVLEDNYLQALVMSYSAYSAKKHITLHTNYLHELTEQKILNRKVEFLPDEKTLLERKAAGQGLTRPELAILLAYTKIHIKKEILKSTLPEDSYIERSLVEAFPESIRKKYLQSMQNHPLKRDIIATQLGNQVINEMGITFVYRLQMETGATVDEIVRAHAVAANIFGTRELQKLIEEMDFKIALNDQYDMLYNLRALINLATRWFLHNNQLKDGLEKIIDHYSKNIKLLVPIIPDIMSGNTKGYFATLIKKFKDLNLPAQLARQIATFRAIYTSLNITEVATANNYDLIKTARIYFAAGEVLGLVWFRDTITADSREGHWNTVARLTLRDELDISQRAATLAIIKKDTGNLAPEKMIELWKKSNKRGLERWDKMLALLQGSNNIDYTMFFIAIRELISLIVLSG